MTTKEDIDALKEVVDSWANQPESIASFIRWNSRAHKYSEWNRLLIRAQRSDATLCMGYNDWLSVGRKPSGKGIGIKVFYPKLVKEDVTRNGEIVEESHVRGYGFTHTYDISNTVSVDPDNDEYEKLIADLETPERSYDELWEFVRFIAESAGIQRGILGDYHSYGFIADDGRQVVVEQGLIESSQVLSELIGIIALTVTHTSERLIRFGPRVDTVGNVKMTDAATVPIDFRTSAIAWAIADRFGVDVSAHAQLMLGNPQLEEDESLNKVLLEVVRSIKMFEQLESGVPYEWAQAYVNATLKQDSGSEDTDEES